MTIRASQVIPVYPLTEDLQPGDVFLVQLTVERQQKLYKQRGFLPLDNHLERLDPAGYDSFYDQSFVPGQGTILPRDWIRPADTNAHYWEPAPHVAFPTYSFSVRRGGGVNLAVPIEGVPVGLSLLASDSADGTVSIKQARTMGVDTLSLYRQLQSWALTNIDVLRYFGANAREGKTNFLRVITRVYATGQMDVSLRDTRSRNAGADVGVARPVDLLFPQLPDNRVPTEKTTAENYTNGWKLLSEMVERASLKDAAGNFLPGGSLRLAAASSRNVTLQEQFDPPIILGYLGFDCAIYAGGILGPPIATHAVLDSSFGLGTQLHTTPYVAVQSKRARESVYNLLVEAKDDPGASRALAAMDAMRRFIPARFTTYSKGFSTGDTDVLKVDQQERPESAGYLDYEDYRGRLERSINALENALKSDHLVLLKKGEDTPRPVTPAQREELEKVLRNYRAGRDDVTENRAGRAAAAAGFAAYLRWLDQ